MNTSSSKSSEFAANSHGFNYAYQRVINDIRAAEAAALEAVCSALEPFGPSVSLVLERSSQARLVKYVVCEDRHSIGKFNILRLDELGPTIVTQYRSWREAVHAALQEGCTAPSPEGSGFKRESVLYDRVHTFARLRARRDKNVASGLWALSMPPHVLRTYCVRAIATGETMFGRADPCASADAVIAGLHRSSAGGTVAFGVLSSGGELGRLEEHIKSIFAAKAIAGDAAMSLCAAAGIVVCPDPDQPGLYLWRDGSHAHAAGAEVSHSSEALAAVDALRALFPIKEFMEQIDQPGGHSSYTEFVCPPMGSIRSSAPSM